MQDTNPDALSSPSIGKPVFLAFYWLSVSFKLNYQALAVMSSWLDLNSHHVLLRHAFFCQITLKNKFSLLFKKSCGTIKFCSLSAFCAAHSCYFGAESIRVSTEYQAVRTITVLRVQDLSATKTPGFTACVVDVHTY